MRFQEDYCPSGLQKQIVGFSTSDENPDPAVRVWDKIRRELWLMDLL
jgi:hypothetical protein